MAQTKLDYDVLAPKDTLGYRHNNPLNLKYGPLTRHWVDEGLAEVGEKATDGGNFIKFKDLETGKRAAAELLTGPRYKDKTVHDALQTWSNKGYGAEIAPGIKAESTIAQLTPEEQGSLVGAMAEREGYPVWIQDAPSDVQNFPSGTSVKLDYGMLDNTPEASQREMQARNFPTAEERGGAPGEATIGSEDFDWLAHPVAPGSFSKWMRFAKAGLGAGVSMLDPRTYWNMGKDIGYTLRNLNPLVPPVKPGQVIGGEVWNPSRAHSEEMAAKGDRWAQLLNMVPMGPDVYGLGEQLATNKAPEALGTIGGLSFAPEVADAVTGGLSRVPGKIRNTGSTIRGYYDRLPAGTGKQVASNLGNLAVGYRTSKMLNLGKTLHGLYKDMNAAKSAPIGTITEAQLAAELMRQRQNLAKVNVGPVSAESTPGTVGVGGAPAEIPLPTHEGTPGTVGTGQVPRARGRAAKITVQKSLYNGQEHFSIFDGDKPAEVEGNDFASLDEASKAAKVYSKAKKQKGVLNISGYKDKGIESFAKALDVAIGGETIISQPWRPNSQAEIGLPNDRFHVTLGNGIATLWDTSKGVDKIAEFDAADFKNPDKEVPAAIGAAYKKALKKYGERGSVTIAPTKIVQDMVDNKEGLSNARIIPIQDFFKKGAPKLDDSQSALIDDNGIMVIGSSHDNMLMDADLEVDKGSTKHEFGEDTSDAIREHKLVRLNIGRKYDVKGQPMPEGSLSVEINHQPSEAALQSLRSLIAKNPGIKHVAYDLPQGSYMGTPTEFLNALKREFKPEDTTISKEAETRLAKLRQFRDQTDQRGGVKVDFRTKAFKDWFKTLSGSQLAELRSDYNAQYKPNKIQEFIDRGRPGYEGEAPSFEKWLDDNYVKQKPEEQFVLHYDPKKELLTLHNIDGSVAEPAASVKAGDLRHFVNSKSAADALAKGGYYNESTGEAGTFEPAGEKPQNNLKSDFAKWKNSPVSKMEVTTDSSGLWHVWSGKGPDSEIVESFETEKEAKQFLRDETSKVLKAPSKKWVPDTKGSKAKVLPFKKRLTQMQERLD